MAHVTVKDQPEDFVIATGVQFSVRQFIQWSALELGIHLKFEGEGVNEIAVVENITGLNAIGVKIGDVIVRVDPRYFRPTEVETLLGNPQKAKDIGMALKSRCRKCAKKWFWKILNWLNVMLY